MTKDQLLKTTKERTEAAHSRAMSFSQGEALTPEQTGALARQLQEAHCAALSLHQLVLGYERPKVG